MRSIVNIKNSKKQKVGIIVIDIFLATNLLGDSIRE